MTMSNEDHVPAEPALADEPQPTGTENEIDSSQADLNTKPEAGPAEGAPTERDPATEEIAADEPAESDSAATDDLTDPAHPHHRAAVIIEDLRRLERRAVHLPYVGKIHAPDTHDVIYAAGMTALIAFGIVEWPIALAVLGGHALIKQHHSRTLSAVGEVMEDFWVR